jgi:hypothetical protein
MHYNIHQWTDSEKRRHYQVILWKISGFILLFFVFPVIAWILGLIRSDLEYPPTPGSGDVQTWIGLIFAAEALGYGKLMHWVWCNAQDPSRSDFWDAKAGKKTIVPFGLRIIKLDFPQFRFCLCTPSIDGAVLGPI